MAKMHRIFYTGEGSQLEGSQDGGKTWETFTVCKVVEYGGHSYVWAPPGMKAVRLTLTLKHPDYVLKKDPSKKLLLKNRTIFVAFPGGPEDSFLDLDGLEVKACFRSSDRDGLVLEADYMKTLSPAKLRERAAKLLEEAAAAESLASPSKPLPKAEKKS